MTTSVLECTQRSVECSAPMTVWVDWNPFLALWEVIHAAPLYIIQLTFDDEFSPHEVAQWNHKRNACCRMIDIVSADEMLVHMYCHQLSACLYVAMHLHQCFSLLQTTPPISRCSFKIPLVFLHRRFFQQSPSPWRNVPCEIDFFSFLSFPPFGGYDSFVWWYRRKFTYFFGNSLPSFPSDWKFPLWVCHIAWNFCPVIQLLYTSSHLLVYSRYFFSGPKLAIYSWPLPCTTQSRSSWNSWLTFLILITHSHQ